MADKELDLRGLVRLLSRQAWLIATTVAISLVVAVVVVALLPRTYDASTVMFVDTASKDSLGRVVGGENGSVDNVRVESEVEIVLTDAALTDVVNRKRLLEDPEFAPRPSLRDRVLTLVGLREYRAPAGEAALVATVQRLRRAVDAERVGLTYLIAVSARSGDPDKAASLANAVADSYIRSQLDAKVQAASAVENVVSARLAAATAAIEESARRFDQLIIDNAADIAALSGQPDVAETGARLRDAVTARSRNEMLLDSVRRSIATDNWPRVAEDLQSPTFAELERQRAELATALQAAPQLSPQAADLAVRLRNFEARLAAEVQTGLDRLQTAVNEADRQAAQYRNQFRTDIITRRLPNLPPRLDSAFAQVVREGTIAQSQAETLLQRKSELEDEAALQFADTRIVSTATAPPAPASPNTQLILALASVLSLGLGAGLALLRENYGDGFTSAGQVEAVSGTRLAASVPREKRARRHPSIADKVVDAPFSAYAESIRRIRAALDRAPHGRAAAGSGRLGRLIVVASTQPGEGKTTTALALARVYAISGQKVLLWDCDTRKPGLHRHLGVDVEVGFADHLRQRTDGTFPVAATARDERSGAFAVLGKSDPDMPADWVLSGTEFRRFVRAAAERFDILILNTAPLGAVVDGLYVAELADQIVFVVRCSKTPRQAVVEGLRQLRERVGPETEIVSVLVGDETGGPFQGGDYGGYLAR